MTVLACLLATVARGDDWSGLNDRWRDIGGIFPRGAPITVVARNPNQLDLFVTGNDGRVYTSWWTAGRNWSGLGDRWRNIGGIFPPGAPIAAVVRNPNQIDLFITGNDGRVYTSGWTAGRDWSGLGDRWRNIGGIFPPGAPISAVARNPNQLDVFVTGNDGRVYTSWWTAGRDWSGLGDRWRNIGGIFPPGAPLGAVARNPNQLDIFVTGNDGRIYTNWWPAATCVSINPDISLSARQDGRRFIEVKGRSFSCARTVRLDYQISTGGAPNTTTSGTVTVQTDTSGRFASQINVTLSGEIASVGVQATDTATSLQVSKSIP